MFVGGARCGGDGVRKDCGDAAAAAPVVSGGGGKERGPAAEGARVRVSVPGAMRHGLKRRGEEWGSQLGARRQRQWP